MSTGVFSGTPKTEWLDVPVGNARDMKIIEAFVYTDAAGKAWDAPIGSIVNGASIPSALWTTVGSPYTGSYRNASIVHDVACVRAKNNADRKAADLMFYEACLAGGCSKAQANELYIGVRIGAWWSPPTAAAAAVRAAKTPLELKRDAAVQVRAFKAIRKLLASRMDSAGPAEIEKLVSAEMKQGPSGQAIATKKKVVKTRTVQVKPKKKAMPR